MHITYATFLAVMALSAAHSHTEKGFTNLSKLEHAAIVYEDEAFQAEAFDIWLMESDGQPTVALDQMDEYFEAFYHSLDAEDLKFITPAIVA